MSRAEDGFVTHTYPKLVMKAGQTFTRRFVIRLLARQVATRPTVLAVVNSLLLSHHVDRRANVENCRCPWGFLWWCVFVTRARQFKLGVFSSSIILIPCFLSHTPIHPSLFVLTYFFCLVIGNRAAQVLAAGLPKGWRVVLVDRNS